MKTNKRKFLALLLAAIPSLALSQKTRKKFYITGLGHTATANDCTIPPIVTYGTDRVDALVNSGLTVWSEEEFREMREKMGKQFDEDCKARATPSPSPPAPAP